MEWLWLVLEWLGWATVAVFVAAGIGFAAGLVLIILTIGHKQ